MEFLPAQVPRSRFVEELRTLLGRPWGEVTDDEYVSCVGVPLLALIGVGLLGPDCDPNLSGVPPSRRFAFLLALLQKHARKFTGYAPQELLPGDFLLSCWADADITRSVVHHVAIFTASEPSPYGTHLQSLAREHGGAGYVYEAPMSFLDWHRVEAVWRLNALMEDKA